FYAYQLLDRLAFLAGKNPAPSENFARETASPSAAKTTPTKSRSTSAKEGSPVHAVITKIDRMKTRQGDSLFLKVDVGGETVRVFGRPEELAERLEFLALEPMNGFAVSQRLKQVSGDVLQVSDGSLYPALHKLEQEGWITAEWKTSEYGRRAKYYSLTRLGRRQLEKEADNWGRL